jgi:hypothetical protein
VYQDAGSFPVSAEVTKAAAQAVARPPVTAARTRRTSVASLTVS